MTETPQDLGSDRPPQLTEEQRQVISEVFPGMDEENIANDTGLQWAIAASEGDAVLLRMQLEVERLSEQLGHPTSQTHPDIIKEKIAAKTKEIEDYKRSKSSQ